jgi:heptaprenyl diphosphate synthase
MMQTRRLTTLAILIASASVLHFVESLVPIPLPVPGIKFGLANTLTLCAIVLLGLSDALWVAGLRVVLGSLLGGYLFSATFAMSLAGAFASTLAMFIIYRFGKQLLSLVSVSICGAIVHNVAQLLVATFLVQTAGVFAYLPYLLLFAVPTGFLTGLISTKLVTHVREVTDFTK